MSTPISKFPSPQEVDDKFKSFWNENDFTNRLELLPENVRKLVTTGMEASFMAGYRTCFEETMKEFREINNARRKPDDNGADKE